MSQTFQSWEPPTPKFTLRPSVTFAKDDSWSQSSWTTSPTTRARPCTNSGLIEELDATVKELNGSMIFTPVVTERRVASVSGGEEGSGKRKRKRKTRRRRRRRRRKGRGSRRR